MNLNQASKEAENLRKKITQHNHKYYVLDDPDIPDAEYDRLFKELIKIEKEFPQLITNSSPTQRIGTTPLLEFKERKIPLLIRRYLPNGSHEDWRLEDMIVNN